MEEDELTAEEEERITERLAAKLARNNSRLDALDSRMQQGFAPLMKSISTQQTMMDHRLMRFKKLDGALVQSSANLTQPSTASTLTAPPSLATSPYPPPLLTTPTPIYPLIRFSSQPLSSLPSPRSSPFSWSVPPHPIPPPTQLPAIPSVSLGKPHKPFVSPDLQSPELPKPIIFLPGSLDPISPKPTSLGSTTTAPIPDDPVDKLEENPPPIRDPDEHQETYATSHLHPPKMKEASEDRPLFKSEDLDPEALALALDRTRSLARLHALREFLHTTAEFSDLSFISDDSILDLQASVATLIALYPKFNASKKVGMFHSAAYYYLSGSGTKSVHWIAQNTKAKVFDARKAQGGGRSFIFVFSSRSNSRSLHCLKCLMKTQCSRFTVVVLVAVVPKHKLNATASSATLHEFQ